MPERISGWSYEFTASVPPHVGETVQKRGTVTGPGLDTEDQVRAELVARWGKDAANARVRRMGDGD